MTEIIHEVQRKTTDDEMFVDPWQVKTAQAREYVRAHRRPVIATSLALAVGLTGGILLSRGVSGSEVAPGRNNAPAAGPAFPGNNESQNPNTTPTQSSGGFNNAGRVILECTGLTIVRSPQDEARTGIDKVYKVTPQVDIKSGDPSSPYLYTVLGTDVGHNSAVQGIGSLLVDVGDNVEFPVVIIVDTAGTKYGPNDPEALSEPTGDAIPDQQLYQCPVVPYPE